MHCRLALIDNWFLPTPVFVSLTFINNNNSGYFEFCLNNRKNNKHCKYYAECIGLVYNAVK